jgi:hypothetical protein
MNQSGRIRILFVAANPRETSRLELDEEIREISHKIKQSKYRDSLELISLWAARTDDLLQGMNEYKPNIVHFSGHGTRNGEIILVDYDKKTKVCEIRSLKSSV